MKGLYLDAVADAVFDRLAFARPEGFTQYGLVLERTSDTETGTKTLRATYKLRGFQMCIR